jgi:hypothetical protein
MKGLRILGDRRAELTTIPQPEPRSGWVVLRSTMSAVCGSDLHLYRQSADRIGDRSNRVAGHESVGVVKKVGPAVEDLAPGTRVVVFQHYGCGRCSYCRTGEPMFCPNRRTFGNHVVHHRRHSVVLLRPPVRVRDQGQGIGGDAPLTVRPMAARPLCAAGSMARRSAGAFPGPARPAQLRRSNNGPDQHAGAAWRPPDQSLNQPMPPQVRHPLGGRHPRRPEDR